MTKQQAQEYEGFISKIYEQPETNLDACAKAGRGVRFDCEELMRLARRHGRMQERLCNGYEDAGQQARAEKADERNEQRITDLLKSSPAFACVERPNLGGDPRGYTVKIILKSGQYNTWGGAEEGWGVPQ